MKKKYIIPCTSIVQAQPEQILASSGVISGNGDINIGYGGIDEDGSYSVDVRESDWEDDWIDE